MSKSKKKQAARRRAQDGSPETELTQVVSGLTPEGDDGFDEPDDGPSLGLPERQVMPLNETLYDQAMAAATGQGIMRDEGDAVAYLYNGDSLSMKFVEGAEGTDQPDRLMIAVFRLGVVFQVEGGQQVVYKPGEWEQEIARLAGMAPAEPTDEAEA